jgi:hypothetical protein
VDATHPVDAFGPSSSAFATLEEGLEVIHIRNEADLDAITGLLDSEYVSF